MHKHRLGIGRAVRIRVPELRLHAGEVAVVLGPNGSGKSTLFDMLALILAPDRIDRFELYERDGPLDLRAVGRQQGAHIRRRHFGYVLQNGGLLDFLTIGENIRLAARLSGRSADRANQVADRLGVKDILSMRPGRVSGGQRRRAALARAFVQRPPILLADEPTSDLDTDSTAIVLDAFRELARTHGTGVLMVTHDETLVHGFADCAYRFALDPVGQGVLSSTLKPDSPRPEGNPRA